ncbi:MAG TPA: hypothetical protein PKM21_09875 [Anaerolineales bacterium]|nr:hypothetical protein [Anaerolineales bacterium]
MRKVSLFAVVLYTIVFLALLAVVWPAVKWLTHYTRADLTPVMSLAVACGVGMALLTAIRDRGGRTLRIARVPLSLGTLACFLALFYLVFQPIAGDAPASTMIVALLAVLPVGSLVAYLLIFSRMAPEQRAASLGWWIRHRAFFSYLTLSIVMAAWLALAAQLKFSDLRKMMVVMGLTWCYMLAFAILRRSPYPWMASPFVVLVVAGSLAAWLLVDRTSWIMAVYLDAQIVFAFYLELAYLAIDGDIRRRLAEIFTRQ